MFFGNSKILWLLLAISIPIIIHLVRLTRLKKVEFTSFKFLKLTLQQGQKPKKLMRLLILGSRILAFTFAILAFAIPSCNKIDKNQQLLVGICLDNSLSMGPKQSDALYFEKQKNILKDIVKNLPSTTVFKLISYSNFGGVSNPLTATEAIKWIEETKISYQSTLLEDLILRLKQSVLNESGMKHAFYILSDFKKGSVIKNDVKTLKLENATLLKAENLEINNLSIDSAWLTNELVLIGETIEIKFKITNWGKEPIANLPVKLINNSTQLGLVAVSCKPNESTFGSFEIKYNENWSGLKIEITDEFHTFDNTLFLNLGLQAKIGVKKQGNSSNFISNVLKTQSIFTENTPFNSVICEECTLEEVKKVIETSKSTKSIILTLGPNNTSASMAQFLGVTSFKQSIGNFSLTPKSLQHSLFTNVFSKSPENVQMPTVTSYYSLGGNAGFMEPILSIQNGDLFYGKLIKNKIPIFVCTGPFNINTSNWVKSFLFLPTITKSILPSLSNKQLYVNLNSESTYFLKNEIEPETLDKGMYFLNGNGISQVASIAKGIYGSELQNIQLLPKNGMYTLSKNNKEEIEKVAVNINPIESNMEMEINLEKKFEDCEIVEAKKGFSQAKAALKNNVIESNLWKWFIGFSIIFFIIEMILVIINRKIAKQNIK